jgi:hypothetical protein
MSRSLIIALCLSLTWAVASAEEPQVLPLLKQHLGSAIEVVSAEDLRYCPDNTCDIFRASSKAGRALLPSFVFLYLFHVSDYIYLDESFGKDVAFRKAAQHDEVEVRRSVERYCANLDKSPQCILEGMKKQLGISVHFGRYDEGSFQEAPVEDEPEV